MAEHPGDGGGKESSMGSDHVDYEQLRQADLGQLSQDLAKLSDEDRSVREQQIEDTKTREYDPGRAESVGRAGEHDRHMSKSAEERIQIRSQYEDEIASAGQDAAEKGLEQNVAGMADRFFNAGSEPAGYTRERYVDDNELLLSDRKYGYDGVKSDARIAQETALRAETREYWAGALHDHPETDLKLFEAIKIVHEVDGLQGIVDRLNNERSRLADDNYVYASQEEEWVSVDAYEGAVREHFKDYEAKKAEMLKRGSGATIDQLIDLRKDMILNVVYAYGQLIKEQKEKLGPLEDYLDGRPPTER